jgi:heme A synthase
MTASPTTRSTPRYAAATPAQDRNPLFSALVGLATVAIFLQAVWAGMMIREGKDYNATWVSIHDWGARVAFLLALAATVVALVRLRSRRDLLIGSAALTVLIFAESYIGGLIGNQPGAVAFHIPLAVGIFGLAIWLPMRTRRRV